MRRAAFLSLNWFLVGFCAGIVLGSGLAALATEPVRSLTEVRQEHVVLQQWDLSCGAAAVATILIYQHGDAVSERQVAISMMEREAYLRNPDIVRVREGFSLLDMKRFVEDLGYRGTGLGRMSFEDLLERAPLIVPVNLKGYQHFVVFRGAWRGRVLLADPSFGNRTMTQDAFERAWIDFPKLGRVGFVVERRDSLIPPNELQPTPQDFVTLR